jgi:hypothetical protein
VDDWPAVAAPEVTVPAEFAGLASAERIAAAAAALQQNGISSTYRLARRSGRWRPCPRRRRRFTTTPGRPWKTSASDDMERSGRPPPGAAVPDDRNAVARDAHPAASPDYVTGSVHALTEAGALLIASASGSLGPPYRARRRHPSSSAARRSSAMLPPDAAHL